MTTAKTARTAIRKGLTATVGLGVAFGLALGAGCKPDKPDVVEARRAEAAARAEQAQQAVATGVPRSPVPTEASELPPEVAAAEVARFGEHVITLGEVAARMKALPPHLRTRYASQDNREELLRSMVQFELLAIEAKRLGLDQRVRVQEAWKDALARELLDDVTKSGLTMADIGDEAIAAYYAAHEDEYVQPERRRVAVLVVEKAEEAAEIHRVLTREIEGSPKEARQIFGDFVRVRSKDEATAARKGDVGWVTAEGPPPEGVPPVVAQQAFTVPAVGQVSAPFALDDGRHALVQVTQVKPAATRTLEAARADIQNALFREKQAEMRQRFIDDLMAKTEVEILADGLDALPAPSGADAPPAHPPRPPHLNDARLRRGLVTTPPGSRANQPELRIDKSNRRPHLTPSEVQELMQKGGGSSGSSNEPAPAKETR